jgi:MYXO-CTERM domain-containing protein
VADTNLATIVETQPTLRGPDARSISGRFWSVAGVLALFVFAVIVVISFISSANDNARTNRLKDHGVSVVVTVTDCVGNIGGSGSNAAGYTCHGSYNVKGVRYQEVIGSETTLSQRGTRLRAVADPSHLGTIELASKVATSSSSPSAYVVPGLLALLLLLLAFAFLRRRSRSAAHPKRSKRDPVVLPHGATD